MGVLSFQVVSIARQGKVVYCCSWLGTRVYCIFRVLETVSSYLLVASEQEYSENISMA